MNDLLERAAAAWETLKSALETICWIVLGVGILALVIHSWILLSNDKASAAMGAIISAVMGAVGGVLWLEQWLSGAQGGIFVLGAAWGRADRRACAESAGVHASLAGACWVLLTFVGPRIVAFGYPSPGLEEKLMWTAFWVTLVQHFLRAPGRIKISWRAATTSVGGLVR